MILVEYSSVVEVKSGKEFYVPRNLHGEAIYMYKYRIIIKGMWALTWRWALTQDTTVIFTTHTLDSKELNMATILDRAHHVQECLDLPHTLKLLQGF